MNKQLILRILDILETGLNAHNGKSSVTLWEIVKYFTQMGILFYIIYTH